MQSGKVSVAERRLIVAGYCPHTVLGYRTFVGEGSKKTGRLGEWHLDPGAVQRKKENGKDFQRPAGRRGVDMETQERSGKKWAHSLRGGRHKLGWGLLI